MINPEIIEKIIETANIEKKDNIVEIGPGLGVLTEKLLQQAKHVQAIEYDKKLIPILKHTLSHHQNLELIEGDALKTAPPSYPYKIVANIPYYITSPLINHYLQPKNPHEKPPSLIVLLVQKEVAEKICVSEGQHTILSLQVQIFGHPSITGTVHKSNFFPQPKVDSAILKIETYQKPLIQNTELFIRIIKTAFAQKRKTLSNSLRSLPNSKFEPNRENITTRLFNAQIKETRRPQSLTIEEWNRVIQQLNKI